MEIIKVTEKEFNQYDSFVTTHPSGSFLQSRSWGDFQNTLGNQNFLFLVKDKSKIIGSAQIFLKKIPKLNKYYLYCGYGPLMEPGIYLDSFVGFLQREFPKALLIRFEPKQQISLKSIPTRSTIRTQPAVSFITDLSQTEDQLLAQMHKKTRYNIRLANKHKVEVKVVALNDHTELIEGLRLLEETANRQGFKDFSQDYYMQMVNNLKNEDNYAKVYVAKLGNQILASAITLDFTNTRTYLFGGSSNEHKNVMAPYALHWQIMLDAKTKGLTKYDWWGLETATGKTAGFAEFKLKFGGNTVEYPPAIDIVNNSAWYTVYNILRKINRLI